MKNKLNEDIFICESAQQSAEHYDTLIWTIFSVGVALSLWILYKLWQSKDNIGVMQIVMLFIGFVVLFYCILAVESFGQKKALMYTIFNIKLKDNFKESIKNLPYTKIEWIAEIILFFVFIFYLIVFFWIFLRQKFPLTLDYFFQFRAKTKLILSLIFFVIAIFLFVVVLINWMLRPRGNNGSCLEEIRKFLMGNKLKNYEEIIDKSLK